MNNLWEIVFKERGDRRSDMSEVEVDYAVCIEPFSSDSVNTAVVFVESIIAQLIEHKKQNQDTAGHSDGQAHNIDQAIAHVFLDIPEGDFQVVFEHDDELLIIIIESHKLKTFR